MAKLFSLSRFLFEVFFEVIKKCRLSLELNQWNFTDHLQTFKNLDLVFYECVVYLTIIKLAIKCTILWVNKTFLFVKKNSKIWKKKCNNVFVSKLDLFWSVRYLDLTVVGINHRYLYLTECVVKIIGYNKEFEYKITHVEI